MKRRKDRSEDGSDPSADLDHEIEMVSLFGPAVGGMIDAAWSGINRLFRSVRGRREQ